VTTAVQIADRLGHVLPQVIDHAWGRAMRSNAAASSLCRLVACGKERNVQATCAAIHLAANDAMSLAQIGEHTGQIEPAHSAELMDRAMQVQQRALRFEQLHRAQALAPSDLFFDDLLPAQALGLRPAALADRSERELGRPRDQMRLER
jgi:hypothetical protein